MTAIPDSSDALAASYQDLRDRADRAFRDNDPHGAHHLASQALEVAKETGDRILVDRATCNRAAFAIILGAQPDVLVELRAVLNHHWDDTNSWLAAYNMCLFYEDRKEFKKGAFYARMAINFARRLERAEWQASSLNQLGNCLLGDSFFEPAQEAFETAIGLLPSDDARRRYIFLENLGYCAFFMGRKKKGLRLLYESLRGIRRTGTFEPLMVAHIDLSFGLLEEARYRYAIKHAMAALQIAEQHDYPEVKRNALYILGQASRLAGNSDRAAGFFHWLQEEFFPDSPEVAGFLHAVDVRPMLNLRA